MLLFIIFALIANTLQYEVPDVKLEVLKPKGGFKISIPDEEGIKLFAFHGKVNEELNGREGGTFSRDVVVAKNGRWTFYEPLYDLKVGDTLYFWTYVDYFDGQRKLGYPRDNQEIVVTDEHIVQVDKNKKPVPRIPQPTGQDGCERTPTTVNGKSSCKGKEIFNESFQTKFSSNIWTTQMRFADEPDYEFTMYSNHADTLSVKDDNLVIRPVISENIYGKDFVSSPAGFNFGASCTGIIGTTQCKQSPRAYLILPPVVSAQLSTKDKFSFKYGTIEIRAKLPKGDWIYPELYLNSQNEDYGSGYDSGQIRIAFTGGNDDTSKALYGGVILGTSTAARNYGMKRITSDTKWTDDYHTFTLVWKEDGITVKVDDKVYGNVYPPSEGFASQEHPLQLKLANRWRSGTDFAPFDKEMYLTVGVGVGGYNFPDRTDGSMPWVNGEPKSQKDFYRAMPQWSKTWGPDSALKIDYIKISAL